MLKKSHAGDAGVCVNFRTGGVPYKDPEIRPSERGKPYGHSTGALRARWRIYIHYICICRLPATCEIEQSKFEAVL